MASVTKSFWLSAWGHKEPIVKGRTFRPIVLGLKKATPIEPQEQAMSIIYEEEYNCPEMHCSYRSSSRRQYRKHMLIHSNDRPFQCYICNYQFKRSDILRQHLLIHSGERPYACGYCPLRFMHRNSRNRHRLTHENEEEL